MDFYIPISSADSIDQTHPSVFEVYLPQRVSLQNDYEIALLEISLPSDLFTLVTEKDSEIYLHNGNQDTEGSTRILLPRKFYLTISDFIEEINELISDHTANIKLSICSEGTVKVEFDGSNAPGITFSPLITDILGLKRDSVLLGNAYASCLPNMLQQHNFLNVCADIVQPLFYGNKQRQLLRRFDVHHSTNRYMMKTFNSPIYFPMSRKDFETITVQITNDNGNPISFARGTVFLLVHIRERKHGFQHI